MAERSKRHAVKGGHAQAVLAALQNEPQVTDPEIERIFQDIRAAAQETIRRAGSPVKIGVVANAGKSLLLGSLVGYANALPVSEVPTTGNVTALRHSEAVDILTAVLALGTGREAVCVGRWDGQQITALLAGKSPALRG